MIPPGVRIPALGALARQAQRDQRAHDVARTGDIAERVGLPVEAAREVLERRTFKAAVDADWAASRQLGVTGVPTFVAGRYGVVGAQPYEVLDQLVRQAAADDVAAR